MRILVDIRHLTQPQPSGVGEYTIQLLHALFRLDKANEYVLLSSGTNRLFDRVPVFRYPRVEHVHVPIPNRLINLSILTRGKPALDRLARGPFDLAFFPNLNMISLSPGVPYVLALHDLTWRIFPQFYSAKMRAWHRAVQPERLIKNARCVIVPSACTKGDLERLYTPRRIEVIPHGVDARFSPKMETGDHGVRSRHKLPKRFALFVGTLEPRKNIDALLDGVDAYRRSSRDDLHLVLAGGWGWKARDLRNRLQHAGGWVHHIGYIPDNDRPALYRAARAFVWPSFYEGFGLPVLEAMACGTPVIASATSSVPEVTGTNAIHIDPYNARDITAALQELLSSNVLQDTLREGARERAKTFSWDESAKKTLAVFEQAAGSTRDIV